MGSGFARRKKEAKLMEAQFKAMEASLQQTEHIGTAGNGLVTIKLNGKCDLIEIKIHPDCMDPEDPEALEDLVRSAFQQAKQAIDDAASTMNPYGF